MEALTIIGAIVALAGVCGVSVALHKYSSRTYDYPPFNIATIGFSFLVGLLIAVGAYLWMETGFSANTLVVLGCGMLVYVILLVFVTVRSNFLIAIWTVTILSALSAVALVLLAVWFILGSAKKSREWTDRVGHTPQLLRCGSTDGERALPR